MMKSKFVIEHRLAGVGVKLLDANGDVVMVSNGHIDSANDAKKPIARAKRSCKQFTPTENRVDDEKLAQMADDLIERNSIKETAR